MKIRPLNENVLLKLHEKSEEVTKSGIITNTPVSQSKKDIVEGEVIAISTLEEAPEFVEGDIVLFDKYSATEIDKREGLYLIEFSGLKGVVLDG